MAKVSPWESPQLQGRGCWQAAELGTGDRCQEEHGHGIGEEDFVDFPSCHGARELRLFFWHFCSQSNLFIVCTEQDPALVYTS